MDAFYIAQMGAEVYYRRKAVGELIETFSRREGRKEHIFSEMEVAKLELNGGGSGATPFQGAAHVRHAILQLFSGEAVKETEKFPLWSSRTSILPWSFCRYSGSRIQI